MRDFVLPGHVQCGGRCLELESSQCPDLNVCLRMIVMTPVLEIIKDAQSEAIKLENRKSERAVGQFLAFDIDKRGLLTLYGWFWVLYAGGTR